MNKISMNPKMFLSQFFSLSNTILILIIIGLLLDFYYPFLPLIFGSYQMAIKIIIILLSVIGICFK